MHQTKLTNKVRCGDDWPTQGEVDIFENVNDERLNQYTLHTSPGCYADSSMDGTGTVLQTEFVLHFW